MGTCSSAVFLVHDQALSNSDFFLVHCKLNVMLEMESFCRKAYESRNPQLCLQKILLRCIKLFSAASAVQRKRYFS